MRDRQTDEQTMQTIAIAGPRIAANKAYTWSVVGLVNAYSWLVLHAGSYSVGTNRVGVGATSFPGQLLRNATETFYHVVLCCFLVLFMAADSIIVSVTWRSDSGGIEARSQQPTGFLQCLDAVGWVIWPVKIVTETTYKVSSGTLSFAHSDADVSVFNSKMICCMLSRMSNLFTDTLVMSSAVGFCILSRNALKQMK